MIGMLSIALLFLISCLVKKIFARERKPGEPPLVNEFIPLNNIRKFRSNPLGFLRSLKRELGNVFTVQWGTWYIHFFTNPYDIRILDKMKNITNHKSLYQFTSRLAGGKHAIDNSGEFDPLGPEVTKAMMTSMAGPSTLSRIAEACCKSTLYAFRCLQENELVLKGKPVPLYEVLGKVIFDINYHFFFGFSKSGKDVTREKLLQVFKIFFEGSPYLVDGVPGILMPETVKARTEILNILSEIKWEDRTGVSDLVNAIRSLDQSEEFKIKTLRHLLVLLWASQANTRPSSFWIIHHLIRHPDAIETILREYEDIRAGKSDQINVDHHSSEATHEMDDILNLEKADLDSMVILDSAIKESLRLVASSLTIREATEDLSIKVADGKTYNVRKGDFTAVYSEFVHMDKSIYETPEHYIYDRFVSSKSKLNVDSMGAKSKTLPPIWAYLTFGHGHTRCIGQQVALIELKLCILMFLRCFKLEASGNTPERPEFDKMHLGFGVMPPKNDCEIYMRPKSNRRNCNERNLSHG